MKRILILLLYILQFAITSNASRLPNIKYNFSYLTEDIGLSHNFVEDIYKDSNGYMWFATHNGISRYDGYNFVNFNSTTTPISLKGDLAYHICEDGFNRLWVASERGIDIIDLENYCTVSLPIDLYSTLWNVMNTKATYIYKDREGSLWISAANSLYCIEFDAEGGVKEYYALEKGVSSSSINAIADLGWGICAGINNSLMIVEKHTENTLKAKEMSPLVSQCFDDWKIQALAVDKETLWIGSNYGLYSYDHFNRDFKEHKQLDRLSPSSSQLHITAIRQNDDGLLFIGTLHGLIVYNKQNDEFLMLQQDLSPLNQSLNSNFINCLLSDKNELWIGTEIGGVNYLSQPKIICHTWLPDRSNSSSLSAHPVSAISADRDGNLWVGTVEGGLNLKRRGKEGFEHYKNSQSDPHSIAHNSISGILIDRENNLWAYTWGMGVSKLNLNIPNNKTFERYYRGATPGMEGNFVSSACEDTINKGIWFGTTEGLHFYDKSKKTFQPIRFNAVDNNFDTMNALLIDSKYRLWIGTSRGVFIVNLFSFARSRRNLSYKHITENLADPKSQKTDKINTIYEDTDGNIWIGCNGSGLYKMTDDKNENYKFVNFTMKDGLPNENIIGILEDKSGNLWLSTNQGVSQLNRSTMVFSNYNKYDGIQGNQFYRNAYYYSDLDDLLYFGNTDGLIAITPEIPLSSTKMSKVLITELSILGKAVYPSSGQYLKSNISNSKDIHLHERDQSIALTFSSCNFDYSKQIRYSYRLKGYEKNWNELRPGHNVASYTYLPSGEYTFEVYATDSKGNWQNNPTSIQIHVEPYFYKSWWFYLLMCLFVLFLIQRFYIWKVNSYRRQKETLENTVRERTATLSVQNKQLISMSRKLAETTEEKIAFFTNITHEFRTPVTLINGPLEVALKRSKDPTVTEQIQLAERSSKYLLALVNELMDFRKIDSHKVTLNRKEDHLLSFLNGVLMPLQAFAKERKIDITIYSRLENENLVLDYEYIRKVIINLVSNAIKFTPNNGKIDIYAATVVNEGNEKMIYLGVRDNGSGIATDELEKIFDRFYQSKKSTRYHIQGQSGTGIGLYLCDKIIRLHGGTIKAFNNKGRGATIRVMLPYVEANKDANISEENLPLKNAEQQDVNPNSSNMLERQNRTQQSEIILVVDDNPDMRSYIRTLLQKEYKILEAEDGAEALETLRSRKIDLILSDLMMPVMNGIDLSKNVKADLAISHIPFIMLTAVVAEEQKKESFQIGVDHYLCKPFDEEVLLYLIRNIFEQQRKFRSLFAINMKGNTLSIAEDSKDSKFITHAIEQMKLNYGDSSYELEQFVRDMGYSKTLVNKKLQDLTGQSIGQFMKNYRLKIAYEIITTKELNQNINISEIAYSVGFNDPKYFTKCFKEVYNILPSTLLTK